MLGSRAVEAFEPVLIEEGGERRLAESRLPDDSEQRGRRFVGFALQRRQRGGALGRSTIERVRTGSEAELHNTAPFGRSQHEMGDFVQDDISLGRTEQRHAVPIEPARHPLGVGRQTEGVSNGERREAMLLSLRSGGALRRGRANSPKHRAREPVGEEGHEAVQRFIERGGWYRRQDHRYGLGGA